LTANETGDTLNEYFTRPYSADSIRWRVEAMCIRRETVDDGSGPVLQGGDFGPGSWNGRATTIAVFNPKGGVGKTTVATRMAAAIKLARTRVDVIVIDLHPSYSALNQAIFSEADRILVPVTPDVPAIRAAVQLRDVARGLGCRERLAMVVNRANSGVSVEDMETTVGMPALALIRSGGLLFVRAANEGRTVIEMFPREKISSDFDILADRVLGTPKLAPPVRAGFRMPLRTKEPARV